MEKTNFIEKLEALIIEAKEIIINKIETKGIFEGVNKLIEIKSFHVQFDLTDHSYLKEVSSDKLIDTNDCIYNYDVLTSFQLLELAYYINSL